MKTGKGAIVASNLNLKLVSKIPARTSWPVGVWQSGQAEALAESEAAARAKQAARHTVERKRMSMITCKCRGR